MTPPVVRKIVVRKNRYFDSVFLMQVAQRIASEPGMRDASALLGTDANRKVLAEMGYGDAGRDPEFTHAGPNDLIIALEGEESAVTAVAADPESRLQRPASAGTEAAPEPRSIAEAAARMTSGGVAVISVPGPHAARESRAALGEGLSVFLFSSNVSVQDERSLKMAAAEKGLIVMGPDCGTAFLCGAGIGFANAVRRGPIGIVGSSGTGIQEFSCEVHRAGSGISHAIGTGSRDLSDAVGGISTMTGIDALETDPQTKVIAVISKPSGESATARLQERLARCSKPVVLCLVGTPASRADSAPAGTVRRASTLDEAAALALHAAGAGGSAVPLRDARTIREMAAAEVSRMRSAQRHVRGLFAGGTFCYQAQAIFRDAGLMVHSNSPVHGMIELEDPRVSRESALVDMGAEVFVEARPHPMIDASLRRKRLEEEGEDSSVALVLLDFILGAISSRNPAGDLADSIRRVRQAARARGDHLCVAASVCGTEEDAQGLSAQTGTLVDAGALVFSTAAEAAAFSCEVALALARRGRAK